ncbi:MAG: hypothetical protein K0R05_3774 [Anaerocolumna sp.]|jgi:50S ribosomal subunit-associated GTPase HflX|nr:hypothetical protein [Anaerocolumna sp.]
MRNVKRMLALIFILSLAFTATLGNVYADNSRQGRNSDLVVCSGDRDQDRLQKKDGSCIDCLYDNECDKDRLRLQINKVDAIETLEIFALNDELLMAVVQCKSEEELWPLMEQIRLRIREAIEVNKLDEQIMLQYKQQLKNILDNDILWKFQMKDQNRIRMRLNWFIVET